MNMELSQHDTCSLVIERNGKFLLIKRLNEPGRGLWSVPGGHREEGETIRECAEREGREEVGPVDVEEKPFLVFTHNVGVAHRHHAHMFRAQVRGTPQAGDDAGEARWFSLEEMAKENKMTVFAAQIFNAMLFGKETGKGGVRGVAEDHVYVRKALSQKEAEKFMEDFCNTSKKLKKPLDTKEFKKIIDSQYEEEYKEMFSRRRAGKRKAAGRTQ